RPGSPFWVDNIKCGVYDESLWQCPSSPWGENSCETTDTARITCTGPKKDITPGDPSSQQELQCPEPRRRTPVTQPPPSLSIPAVAFVVLGALLFLLLVVLGVLVSQNRGLRRALSKGDHAPLHEAVYEEIEYKLAREGTYSAPRWGSVLSEDPPSGYENVPDSEGHSLSGKGVELSVDVGGGALWSSQWAYGGCWELGDAAENYDDIISADQLPGSAEGELLKGDALEHYDDVITEEQSPGDHVPEDTEQNYDDAVTLHWSQEGESILAPEGPPAPDGMDYDDQAADEEPLHVEDEGSEDAEDEGDPALHHPAPPSGKAPTHPAALRPVPSPPTQQTAPLQPSTAGAPGTEPEVNRSAEGQTGSWATGTCGEEGRRARQAVDCSPTRGQAPPPLPFPSPGQADEGPFPGNLSPEVRASKYSVYPALQLLHARPGLRDWGPATGPIWLDKVGCVGNETSLWECPPAEWGQTDCGHKQDVMVLCSEYKQLRLRQGDDTRVCSGLAEVFYNGTWGSVCGNGMTGDTATVICRQFGCGRSKSFEQITTSLPSGSPFWIDSIKCGVYD
ncbi:hypothetical protein JZ751_029565, partial [Albula glossodonta]